MLFFHTMVLHFSGKISSSRMVLKINKWYTSLAWFWELPRHTFKCKTCVQSGFILLGAIIPNCWGPPFRYHFFHCPLEMLWNSSKVTDWDWTLWIYSAKCCFYKSSIDLNHLWPGTFSIYHLPHKTAWLLRAYLEILHHLPPEVRQAMIIGRAFSILVSQPYNIWCQTYAGSAQVVMVTILLISPMSISTAVPKWTPFLSAWTGSFSCCTNLFETFQPQRFPRHFMYHQ